MTHPRVLGLRTPGTSLKVSRGQLSRTPPSTSRSPSVVGTAWNRKGTAMLQRHAIATLPDHMCVYVCALAQDTLACMQTVWLHQACAWHNCSQGLMLALCTTKGRGHAMLQFRICCHHASGRKQLAGWGPGIQLVSLAAFTYC